jgi:type IV pilus assembly protein PilA
MVLSLYMKNRGFTLIELLVVIAIIGLLSAVVLASLNSARAKGADASIKSNLKNAMTQAQLYYDNQTPNSYTGLCADATIAAAINAAKSSAGISAATNSVLATAGSNTLATCHENGSSFAIEVPLKSNSANGWCVDDTGVSRQGTHLTASDVTCN